LKREDEDLAQLIIFFFGALLEKRTGGKSTRVRRGKKKTYAAKRGSTLTAI